MPTDDGYPTDEELQRIHDWPPNDPHGWFAFIRSCWWSAEWGWTQSPRSRKIRISTGGWSGNEDIVDAMRSNLPLWVLTWQSQRRGGHYEFELPRPPRKTPASAASDPGRAR